jgi:serine/threonine-protein kinase RsbW
MPPKSNKTGRLLGRVAPESFVGRGERLREVTALAAPTSGPHNLLLLAAPHSGASELLRQSYDELFRERGAASPVYFDFSRRDRTTETAARRFLHTFLAQTIAHRRHDATLISVTPPLRGLLDLAAPSDYEWVESLVESFERAQAAGDERSLVRICFGAPAVAAARGARTVVLLDDVHTAEHLKGEVELGAELAQAAAAANSPFVLAGLRRRLLDVLNGTASAPGLDAMRHLHLSSLNDADARTLLERHAREQGVGLNEETRDLAVQQLEGSPTFINFLVGAARARGTALESFRQFQRLYVDELLGGGIHRRFAAVLEEVAPFAPLRRGLLRVLYESATSLGGKSPVEVWFKKLQLDAFELERLMRALHAHELASFQATYVEATPGPVWRDFLRASYRLQVAVEPRALVVADTLVETLKRAPETMARHYRRAASLKLKELLARFDFQRVPASLLHYDRYARLYRGVTAEEVAAGLETETDLVRLPQIVHAASGAWFHPPLAQVCDEERCAVAHGFESASYAEAGEVVWVAAEIESKLEAGRGLTELWLDRLTQLAAACGFERARLWLVAPEGFSAEASELLHERNAYGSSRRQLELLAERLGESSGPAPVNEFAMEIPMGEDTELIAAHTVEQIARRMEFDPESINQIKTALVEACINASEHSLSTERKIYNRFRVEDDKLVVTVSSRGLSAPAAVSENGASLVEQNGRDSAEGLKGRRGWGLKLIRTLMDDVEFERADDGTRLRMTKYLRK